MRTSRADVQSRQRLSNVTARGTAVAGQDAVVEGEPIDEAHEPALDLEPDPLPTSPGWLTDTDDDGHVDTDPHSGSAAGREWLPERWRGARVAIGRRGAVALAVVGLLAAAGAGVGAWRDRPVTQPAPPLAAPAVVASESATPSTAVEAPEEMVVSVQGLVNAPGLKRLEVGSRIADALDAAGGALPQADLISLNMAQRLSDGEQVLVGVAPADGGPPQLGSATVGGAAASGTTAGAAGGAKVDLNAAGAAELDALPGVGPATAEAILQWRKENGRFASVDQLGEVKGIGPAKLAKLKDLVRV
ncbi:helix-hairpin-helix domain-containing protein [Speluncibacter jeojiensis]|uniref:Helix-hairpin-helix domain-containing protein n=1 Tax=Speluncibacter jeojiensis TaxID=2710754 RepID=A0A9X4RFS5_9ACTN|nr:helix-hairpin-helix domain-containing protein [Corynebacteriales bacterium D3-21]